MRNLYSNIYKALTAAFIAMLILGANGLKAQTPVCAPDTVVLTLAPYSGSIQWEVSVDGITWTAVSGATNDSLSVFPSMNTWYRAEITDGTCNPIYSDTAEVIPASPAIVTPGDSLNLCQGSTITLNASSGVSYLWSNGDTSPSTTITSGGSYSVLISDTNGCTIQSNVVVITDVPAVFASAGPDTITGCGVGITIGGSPTGFGGAGPYTYSWSPSTSLSSDTTSNPVANPNAITDYVVMVTDQNGCMASDTVTVSPSVVPDSVGFAYSGTIVNWQVPSCVTSITIKALGAGGGASTWNTFMQGGAGAYIQGTFAVTPGQTLSILVGQAGESAAVGGGGGGTFVVDSTTGQPLVVAGGGGGASSDNLGVNAPVTQNGTMDSQNIIAGGASGNGGSACALPSQNNGGGGGGLLTDGQDANAAGTTNGGYGGKSFFNGGAGGVPGRQDGACTGDGYGGFGGGGSTSCNTVGGGGGGGYSGGAGGPHISQCGASLRAGGGGGGSFNGGTSQVNTSGINIGNNGSLLIVW